MPIVRLAGPFVFVDVDTQRDFLEPGRPLFIAGSPAVAPNLKLLTDAAREHAVPVIATACAHRPDSAEFAQFPPHCLIGSAGAERIDATAWPGTFPLPIDATLAPSAPLPPHLTLEKDAFDVFSRPDARDLVARYNANRPTFVVYGVATDFCVKCAVEGLLEAGCAVALVVDAIRPVSTEAEPAILTSLAHAGVTLVATEVVLNALALTHAR